MQGGGIGVSSAVPSADQQERHDADTFSADKELEYVVCGDKDDYGDQEDEKKFEETVHLRVCVHVPGGEL